MIPGEKVEVFDTRLGRFAVLICYENMFAANWDELRGKVDYVLSPYNCEGDPSGNNIAESDKVFAVCDQWFHGSRGKRVPIDESCQLWLPVSFDPATGVAKMLQVQEWEPWK